MIYNGQSRCLAFSASFLSSLSLFHWLSPSSTLISILSISAGLLTGPVWLIWVLTAGISKGYYLYGCSWYSLLPPSRAHWDEFVATSVYLAITTHFQRSYICRCSNSSARMYERSHDHVWAAPTWMENIDLQRLDPPRDVKILRDKYSVRKRRRHEAMWGKEIKGDIEGHM